MKLTSRRISLGVFVLNLSGHILRISRINAHDIGTRDDDNDDDDDDDNDDDDDDNDDDDDDDDNDDDDDDDDDNDDDDNNEKEAKSFSMRAISQQTKAL